MDEVNDTLIAMAAENYADSLERRGCSFWQGLYKGYIAGYRASECKETTDESSGLIKPDVIKSEATVCESCGFHIIDKPLIDGKCDYCRNKQTVL